MNVMVFDLTPYTTTGSDSPMFSNNRPDTANNRNTTPPIHVTGNTASKKREKNKKREKEARSK
jgi:hypothetical protein